VLDSAEPRRQNRLQILDDTEIAALYDRPCFTPEERSLYFTLTQPERDARAGLRALPSQLYFMLQLAYFKDKQRFFSFTFADAAADVAYLLAQEGLPPAATDFASLDRRTIGHQRRLILTLFRYRHCGPAERQQILTCAQQAARRTCRPVYIFREIIQYLLAQRIVLPSYTVLQDLVGKVLTEEQQRLMHVLQTNLAPHERAACDALLVETDGHYPLTQLKHTPKDISLGEMRRELGRGAQLRALYPVAQQIMPRLEIASEGIAYYASLVSYYTLFRLQQLDPWLVSLYVLCFVVHRYQQCHDHLIDALIQIVNESVTEAKAATKEHIATLRREHNADLPKVGQVLKLFTSDQIAANTPFQRVRATAFAILDRQKIEALAEYIGTDLHVDDVAVEWVHVERQAQRLKRHLRPLLLAIGLHATRADAPLMAAVQCLKTTFAQGRALGQLAPEAIPTQFIPVRLRHYLYITDPAGQKRLILDRYEVLVYRQLRNALESGDLFCRDSVRFRSFEDDLISASTWQEKDRLVQQTGLPCLIQPIHEQLAALEQELEAQLVAVNQRIANGENQHIRLKRRGDRTRWSLHYPRGSDPVNHPLFEHVPPVDLVSLMQFVQQTCPFLANFTHVLGRYVSETADAQVLIACLIAWGTNMGVGRMGAISDIPTATLARASENCLRLETLHAANDCLSNAIAALPIFHVYDLGGVLHSSSDGQKFETALPTINARHLPKYFGLHKGVVGYTLVVNHIPVQARIIGAHEHESYYVFDLLMGNTSTIRPAIHSTDTHGTNEVNFALLQVFNYQFAPRYKNLSEKVRHGLYGFQHPSQYPDLILKPIRKIHTELIVAEWANLQRIFVSLAGKTTSQSTIVRKLNAYARHNQTRQALWEYDKIFQSLYLLTFVDSPPMRQNVQRALNRGENYHQLFRAVSYANFGKLRYRNEDEQQLWHACGRVLTNCIIYYNASILSRLLQQKHAMGDTVGAEQLSQVSPVAWQHINFYGRYEFTTAPSQINLDAIVAALIPHPIAPIEDERV